MLKHARISTLYALVIVIVVAVAACTGESETSSSPPPTLGQLPEGFSGVEGILSETAEWPRILESSEGVIELPGPPQNILALSVGHDEMVLELLQSTERLAGVGEFTVYQEYSNVADRVANLTPVSADVEQVLNVNPDIVIVSKYTDADFVALLKDSGLNVFRSELENSSEGNINNILALGYLIGEEDNAVKLAEVVTARLAEVEAAVPDQTSEQVKTLALTSYGGSIWTSGTDSTVDRIIELAGGVNAAAEVGLEGNLQISLESILAMSPDYIIIPQSAEGEGAEFLAMLQQEPSLASVPAVVSGNIDIVDPRHFNTLSHWNVCGVEDLALLLYPERIAELEDFAACVPFLQ